MRMRRLSLKGKAAICNSLVLSKAWSFGRVYLPKAKHIREMEVEVFPYISESKHERVAGRTITMPVDAGGLGLLSIEDQRKSLQAVTFAEIALPIISYHQSREV